MLGNRILKGGGALLVAIPGCYLAYLSAAFWVLELPKLVLAALTDVELQGFQFRRFLPQIFPGVVTRFPSHGSTFLYALYQGGFLLSGAAALAFAGWAARRLRGWLQLYLTQTVFWAAVLVALYASLLAVWNLGPLTGLLRALWPTHAASWPLRISFAFLLGIPALLAAYPSIRHLLDSAAVTLPARALALVGWLLLPAGIVTVILLAEVISWRNLVRWSITFWVVGFVMLLVLLIGLPALFRRARVAPPWQPRFTGALVLTGILVLTQVALHGQSQIVRLTYRGGFVAQPSKYRLLHFEADSTVQNDRSALAAAADERLATIAQRLGLKPTNPKLHAYFYASTGSKKLLAESDEPFTLEIERRTVHHLLAPGGGLTDARGDALLLMHATWGKPGSEAVGRALARYAVGNFHGHSLADYAARITREEGAYSLRDIFQLDTDYLSPLVRDALGGAWVEFLVERRDPSVLPLLYRAPLVAGEEEKFARSLGSSWKELERDWHRFLRESARRATPSEPPSAATPFFHRGLSFSHEFGGDWGYGSDHAQRQLVRIRALGANAIAVVPYAGTRAPREPRISFRMAETDARVIRTIQAAQQLGLHVMLKPQLWGHHFTGDIVFDDLAKFKRWFALYRRWLLHFARMAELYQVDLLVVGTELGGVTDREAPWRALISDVRRIYHGPLTYAANWGSEFETLPFWDALDYLGVNMYYPLAEPGESPRADSPRVQALVGKFAALANKHKKPVIFTEVGFPATANAAAAPWKEDGAPLNTDLQARCYATIFEAFYNQPWFAGLYWWKWPSHGQGNPYNASYNPIGKPALPVIQRWYQPPVAREKLAGHANGAILIQERGEGQ